jgi:hypothetical protein
MTPAHLRPIPTPTCQHGNCVTVAIHELWNTRNELIGRYCGRHAPGALRDQQAYEEDREHDDHLRRLR